MYYIHVCIYACLSPLLFLFFKTNGSILYTLLCIWLFFFSPHFVYLGDPSPLVNEDLAFLFLENECVAFHCMDELCIRLFSNSGSKKPYMYHFKHVLA